VTLSIFTLFVVFYVHWVICIIASARTAARTRLHSSNCSTTHVRIESARTPRASSRRRWQTDKQTDHSAAAAVALPAWSARRHTVSQCNVYVYTRAWRGSSDRRRHWGYQGHSTAPQLPIARHRMPRARPHTRLYRRLHCTARRHRPPGAIVDNDWPTFEPPHTHAHGPALEDRRPERALHATPRSCVHTTDMYSWHAQLTAQLIARVVHGTTSTRVYILLLLYDATFTHILYRRMSRHLCMILFHVSIILS